MFRLKIRLALLTCLLLTPSACDPPSRPVVDGGSTASAALPPAAVQPVPGPASTPVASPGTLLQPAALLQPTALLQPEYPVLHEELPPARPTMPVAPNPLMFAFPTSGPDPISLWRPPLYPTPWEPTAQDHFYFTRPIGANDVNWPLAKYRYGYLLYAEPHTGIDIPAPKGTPIMAAGSGTVTHAGYGLYMVNDEYKDPYGIAVAIKHDFGYQGKVLYTIYGHLDQVYVYPGQRVKAGEQIGVVGETGKVSGPHLHFEIRLGDYRIFSTRNPELWISPPQGWGVLVGRLVKWNGDKIPMVKAKLVNLQTSRSYETISYAEGSVNSDDYYKENLVLGDLPGGDYTLILDNDGVITRTQVVIHPGQVTFFSFNSRGGFDLSRPPDKNLQFVAPATP